MHLSPSEHHRYLLSLQRPRYRYDGGDVNVWRRGWRRQLRRLLGDWPRERCPLAARQLWQRPHPLGTMEKLVFTAEPYADVTGYLCLPSTGCVPYPVMICLQGHTSGMHHSIAVEAADETTPMTVAGDRDFALGCLRRGWAALCLEQRSLGERRELRQEKVSPYNRCHDAFVQALMLGRTLLGERVYDVDRGIDYLLTRPEIDSRRIGVMGNSGGGTVAIYAAAVLPRLAYAMPSCSFGAFAETKMALYHCACGYVPRLAQYAEMADVLGLFAPKPVVVVAGQDDPIIPLPGARRAFEQLQEIYRAAGAGQRCRLVVGPEGHRFYAAAAWEALQALIGG